MEAELAPRQQIDFHTFAEGCLERLLDLEPPPLLAAERAFRQLRYVERYVAYLGCSAIAIERHYIDRDHMEDHSVFYSKSLHPYPNYCSRVHFFRDCPNLEAEFERLRRLAIRRARRGRQEAYLEACRAFSSRCYIGFAVIKPLRGCPIGRTVLATYPESADDRSIRDYQPRRREVTHVAGLTLAVDGLAFQQQDVGVSACATTAIWSSLQKMHDFEHFPSATPAQITGLAARYSLPFGQPMPSEGLSVGQMCQAVQSLGLAPNLIPARDFENTRGYIHSMVKSGFAPVVVLNRRDEWHAATISGVKLRGVHQPAHIADGIDDEAGDLVGLYLHDDRIGPYVRADIRKSSGKLSVRLAPDTTRPRLREQWRVTHLLVPVHPKIRLSFAALRDATVQIANIAHAVLAAQAQVGLSQSALRPHTLRIRNCITPSTRYVFALSSAEAKVSRSSFRKLTTAVPLPRYIAVSRLAISDLGAFDVLLDSTSTRRNVHCLAVLPLASGAPIRMVLREVANVLRCDLID